MQRNAKIKQAEVPYVGHILSKDGFKPDSEKIRAVKEMKPPENVKELKHSSDLSSILESSCQTWPLKVLHQENY